MIKYKIMKNIFSISILFFLVSCGSDDKVAEEEAKTAEKEVINFLFDGNYQGTVNGFETRVFVKAESMTLETDNQNPINCVIEDPAINPTYVQCSGISNMATLERKGSSLIMTPEGEIAGIFRLKE